MAAGSLMGSPAWARLEIRNPEQHEERESWKGSDTLVNGTLTLKKKKR